MTLITHVEVQELLSEEDIGLDNGWFSFGLLVDFPDLPNDPSDPTGTVWSDDRPVNLSPDTVYWLVQQASAEGPEIRAVWDGLCDTWEYYIRP